MTRRRLITALALVAAGMLVNAAPARAAQTVHCGQVLTTDTTVANDLHNCRTIGLVIGAQGVDLDLNGHTIDGDGTSDFEGIQAKGYDNVSIRDGVVTDFVEGVAVLFARNVAVSDLTLVNHRHVGVFADTVRGMTVQHVVASAVAYSGVYVTRSSGVRVQTNTVRRSGDGIALVETSGSSVTGNELTRNGCLGIDVSNGSRFNVVDGNAVSDQGCEGVVVDGSSSNTVTRNTLTHNDGGIGLAYADGNVIAGNVIRNNNFVGIYVFASGNNRLDANVLSGNGEGSEGGIHVLADGSNVARGNTLTRNTVTDSVGDGILVDAGSPATTLDRNVSNHSSDDGIDVDEQTTTLRANQANNNRDLGIEAVAGVTDAGGNTASGNGDRTQCTHVAC
jgi:parallel beta-helix repeat protein